MSHEPRLASPGRPGGLATPEDLVDLDALLTAYGERHPDPGTPGQRVSFGTSGHRGSALANQDHAGGGPILDHQGLLVEQ